MRRPVKPTVEEKQPVLLEDRDSPVTVYFLERGMCIVDAYAAGDAEYEEVRSVGQSLTVAKDPSEQITFASPAPSDATVGGSYAPTVRSSAGLGVMFSIATPSVCGIVLGLNGGSHVSLNNPGTCTIDVRQAAVSELEPPAAQQSFTVSEKPAAPTSTGTTEPRVKRTPTKKKPQVLCAAEASKCATLIVFVYSGYAPITETPEQRAQEEARYPKGPPHEHVRLRIAKLGPGHKVLAVVITKDHKLRVASGRYVIETPPKGRTKKEVTVRVRQVLEVTLDVPVK